jgi:hypothetical protein
MEHAEESEKEERGYEPPTLVEVGTIRELTLVGMDSAGTGAGAGKVQLS